MTTMTFQIKHSIRLLLLDSLQGLQDIIRQIIQHLPEAIASRRLMFERARTLRQSGKGMADSMIVALFGEAVFNHFDDIEEGGQGDVNLEKAAERDTCESTPLIVLLSAGTVSRPSRVRDENQLSRENPGVTLQTKHKRTGSNHVYVCFKRFMRFLFLKIILKIEAMDKDSSDFSIKTTTIRDENRYKV